MACALTGLQGCVVAAPVHGHRRRLRARLRPCTVRDGSAPSLLDTRQETSPRPSRGELAATTMAPAPVESCPWGSVERPRVSVPVPPHHSQVLALPRATCGHREAENQCWCRAHLCGTAFPSVPAQAMWLGSTGSLRLLVTLSRAGVWAEASECPCRHGCRGVCSLGHGLGVGSGQEQ